MRNYLRLLTCKLSGASPVALVNPQAAISASCSYYEAQRLGFKRSVSVGSPGLEQRKTRNHLKLLSPSQCLAVPHTDLVQHLGHTVLQAPCPPVDLPPLLDRGLELGRPHLHRLCHEQLLGGRVCAHADLGALLAASRACGTALVVVAEPRFDLDLHAVCLRLAIGA